MSHLRSSIVVLLGVVMVAELGAAQESVDVPFYMPTPDGWRTETLAFPLDFAPELEYEGLEELRFSPGMFQNESADFWSYVFVWWLPEGTRFDAERLQTDLEHYFRGLTTAVAEAREFDPGEPDCDVRLKPTESSTPDRPQWEGTAQTYDPFATRKPIRLRVLIDIVPCPSQSSVAAFFQLSPQLRLHEIWGVMGAMRHEFRCEG